MQSVAVLLGSIIIGLALSAVQIAYSFEQQRSAAMQLNQEVLTLAEGGATAAAWTLDKDLANSVVSSVIAMSYVHRAIIRDDQGQELASAGRAAREEEILGNWVTRRVAGYVPNNQRELTVEDRGRTVTVGTLRIDLSPDHIAQSVLSLALSTVLATLVSAFLIGLLLLWISARFVTTPLRRAASSIEKIDPDNEQQMRVPVPAMHRTNELGHLLEHTNGMLSRLAQSQLQLRRLATRDPLTGLPNRSQIQQDLQVALAHAARSGGYVAVLFLDLDRFKNVNDSLGHDAGDELLVAVANALRRAVRTNDSVGRLGGDEFLIVLDQIDHLDEVVAAVNRLTQTMSMPYRVGNNEIRAAGSFGIAVYPDDGKDAGTLMRCADLAMYNAKAADAVEWRFFSRELGERVEARLNLENALAGAIARNEFSLVYQPKFWAADGTLAGCEALLRWHHDERLVSAGEFITIAEDAGLIMEIGDWVFTEACRQIAQWGEHAVPVAVNVSAVQLKDVGFVDRLLATMRDYDVAAHLLEVELTETVLMRDLVSSEQVLRRLLDAGIRISIDDFGTGYSSLSYLTRLPISSLKIDRSFVSGERRSRVILDTIVAMARALGMQTVAEGVETAEQRDALIAQGCDLLQGFLLGRPSAPADFEALFMNVDADSRTHSNRRVS